MRILFFAHLKELAGVAEYELSSDAPMDAEELWARLFGQYPLLRGRCDRVRLARNGIYLQANEKLEPEDEVALIPPVSGG